MMNLERIYTADFETTTQIDDCHVWAWSMTSVDDEYTQKFGTTIDQMMNVLSHPKYNYTIYFHNLKFDGEFLLHWLFDNGFTHVTEKVQTKNGTMRTRALQSKEFSTLIADNGMFYCFEVCFERKGKKVNRVKIIDSLKILNFSVEEVAEAFNLPLQKGSVDYEKPRPVGYEPTPEEWDYVGGDAKIMAMALNGLFKEGLTKMTAGSNALSGFKGTLTKRQFQYLFPVLPIEMDSYIRKSYKGGFCYVNPLYKGKDVGEGLVYDVNSMYPWVMRERELPCGVPVPFKGKYEYDPIYKLYVCHIRCMFELKPNMIPTIQVKKSRLFQETEWLKNSNGEDVDLYLTNIDLDLFLEHYNVYNIEYIDGMKFRTQLGTFNQHIDYWMEQKNKAKKDGNATMKNIAKLMLNSLYGKFGTNPETAQKIPEKIDGIMHYKVSEKEFKEPIYIPLATFVTAYARARVIDGAQAAGERFLYADTDSLHILGTEELTGIDIDSYKLGAWDKESVFEKARYLSQKTYIEYIYNKQGIPEPKCTCAGLPKTGRALADWDTFRYGATFPGKLMPKHVIGGVVLVPEYFTIKY